MAEELDVGIIGCGLLGLAHADALSKNDMSRVVAVADVRSEVAERAAEQVGATAYAEYGEMLTRETLDLVVVATPDPLHRAPIEVAAQTGVPYIVTEKPMATTVEDAEAIRATVKATGSTLYVFFPNRYAPLDNALRYAIRKGLIGEAVYGEVRLDDHILVPTAMWGDRSKEWAGGSSPAHFLLSHVVDLMRWYVEPAEVTEVFAITQQEVLGYTPDVYDAFLFFDNGMKVRVKAEWIKHMDGLVEFYEHVAGCTGSIYYNKIPGFGTQAGLRVDVDQSMGRDQLFAHQEMLSRKGLRSKAILDPGSRSPVALEFPAEENRSDRGDVWEYYLRSMVEGKIDPTDGEGPGRPGTLEDGFRQVQIVCAIIESARTGCVVKIESETELAFGAEKERT